MNHDPDARAGAARSVAVVGLGYWGPNLVRNLHELEDAEVAWICDRRPESLRKICAAATRPSGTTAYDETCSRTRPSTRS